MMWRFPSWSSNKHERKQKQSSSDSVVFLFDVDNTLLDDDQIVADLKSRLERELGPRQQKRYWEIFEERQDECRHADYLGALQRYCDEHPTEPHLTQVSSFLIDYPFKSRLYLRALEVVRQYKKEGIVVLFSDGDVVFQPRKIERSGLAEAAGGHMLVYAHKEKALKDVSRRHPCKHYVVVDDNVRILSAIKDAWRDDVTTVFVRQGHFASDPKRLARYPEPDMSVERIGDLLKWNVSSLRQAATRSESA